MSQHIWRTTYKGKPVDVLVGWDRPLNNFFLTVLAVKPETDPETGEEFDLVVYDTDLGDPSKPRLTAGEIVHRIYQLELPYPAGLRTDLLRDEEENSMKGRSYGFLRNIAEGGSE